MNETGGQEEMWSSGFALADKRIWWSIFIILNGLGVVTSGSMMVAIGCLSRKSEEKDGGGSHVLIAGLLSGCFAFSFGCMAQCWQNAIEGHFMNGRFACEAMSWYHITSIVIMYTCLTRLAWHTYYFVAYQHVHSTTRALAFVCLMWIVAGPTVYGVGSISQLYFAQSGTFCLYAWNSPVFFGLVIPLFVICTLLIGYAYRRLNQESTKVMDAIALEDTAEIKRGLRRRLTILLLTFVLCWILVVPAAFIQLMTGNLPGLMDVILAALASLNSTLLPLLYGAMNPTIKHAIRKCCLSC